MTLEVYCPHCTGKASCDDSELGQNAPCPHCGVVFTLVSPAQAARAAKAPPPQVQVALASQPSAPPPAPSAPPSAPSTPVRGVQKVRETRSEFVNRIRKESSYSALRGLLVTVRNLTYFVAVLVLLGGILMAFAQFNPTTLVQCLFGASISLLIAAIASATYQASIVVVDIADTLIDEQTTN